MVIKKRRVDNAVSMLYGIRVKRADLVKRLAEMGWVSGRKGKGSHEIFVHPDMTRPIPVPTHGKDIPEPLAKTILDQAGSNLRKPGSK